MVQAITSLLKSDTTGSLSLLNYDCNNGKFYVQKVHIPFYFHLKESA
mgnify:CR=1 FL=1